MKNKITLSAAAFLLIFGSFWVFGTPNIRPEDKSPAPEIPAVEPGGNPEELGKVHWLRDLEAGRAEAQKTGKPILILFQEVPGCSNCTRYGNTTLSDPLIVEAIETCFVPVCIYNNKGGKDAEALQRFSEPAWNNPVVRIVRADYQDIVLRIPNFRSSLPLVNGMRRALEMSGREVPRYMELVEEELAAREAGLQVATFSMYCFWTGEGTFGALPGVIETQPGYQDGREVVKVWFDPSVTSKAELERQTQPKNFTACAKNEGFRVDNEPKYYMAQTEYKRIQMTSLQACRVNSLIGKNQSPDHLLSPRQLALIKKGPQPLGH
ncbi:MAG TPA: VPGUxxT family thioredoxin-like (seleno)protein, type 2 [Saprospiraceae bacterium]|nr:VPGUxxT family thioredoxin-like (seleno)protein, type 2 [Saprospiraceae bacterium]